MKKKLTILFAIMLITSITYSQEIGVRFGESTGGNVALDGIFSLGQFSRVHGDISFGENGVGIDLLWNFIYRPLSGEAIKWYAGVGPFVNFDGSFGLGIVGELGLEYRFIGDPISISADWRPSFRIIDYTDIDFGGFGFNIRYIF
ncbi:MAG: hypothetical protein L3J41_14685 [Melioribacteraceae bacterium]|nr:hypothetical protein [Melioribacteraceae bacterium]